MCKSDNVLVTGADGQLGRALLAKQWPIGLVPLPAGRNKLDIRDVRAVKKFFAETKVSAVINAAAFTQVDRAETNLEAARITNVEGPRIIAQCCYEANVPLLHVSTDFVFDGTKPTPYVETDATRPLSVYGLTKRDAEIAIAEVNPDHLILRVGWSYGLRGRNFLTTMLELAEQRSEVPVVADQIGAPTHHSDIASALLLMLQRVRSPAVSWGIFHFANTGFASRFEVATRIFDALRSAGMGAAIAVPTSSAAYATPARRPLNSRLDTSKYQNVFGHKPVAWQQRLDSTLAEYIEQRVRAQM